MQGRVVKRHAVAVAALVMLTGGLLAAPAGAAVHRGKRAKHHAAHARTTSFYATIERGASGSVTAVSSTNLTITDDTGQPKTFVAEPSEGLRLSTRAFTGVKVGDRIDVTYHQSAAGNVADTVDDEPGDG